MGPFGGAIALPELPAVGAVVGGEEDPVAGGRQPGGNRGAVARPEVAHRMRARGRAVRRPELGPVLVVIAGEEEPVPQGSEGRRLLIRRLDLLQELGRTIGGDAEQAEAPERGRKGEAVEGAPEGLESAHLVQVADAAGPRGRAVATPELRVAVRVVDPEEGRAAEPDGLIGERLAGGRGGRGAGGGGRPGRGGGR